MLLQRPTGQRITRNSRLDSAEFERAPADLAFLHRFASLCFALASPRLASSLLASSLLSSPLLSSPPGIPSLSALPSKAPKCIGVGSEDARGRRRVEI